MELRDYQQQAVNQVLADWQTHTDVLGVAATGAGKTQILLAVLMDALDSTPEARGLVVSHRVELVDQPMERIRQFRPAWLTAGPLERPRIGAIQAVRGDVDRQLTFATVQSLTEKRLARLLMHGPITHLVIDESHHATAESYLTLLTALKQANPALRHLGVTATPLRADGDGLAKVYQAVAFRITIADLVQRGYLVQPRWLAIQTGLSVRGVQTSRGDFVQAQLAKIYDTDTGRAIILGAYQQYAGNRSAIAFTASVAGAYDLAAAFRAAGIRAETVEANTPPEERRRLLTAYRAGDIRILTNVDVLTEGFDAPGTSCILMCRPTRSDGRYLQAMGRGLRPAMGMAQPGEDCVILDFIPEETRNIVLAGDVLGLPKETTRTALTEQTVEPGEVQAGFTFDGLEFNSNGTPLEIISRELNYLEQSAYIWHRAGGALSLGCGEGADRIERILYIERGQLYALWRRVGLDNRRDPWSVRRIDCDDPYAHGQELAARNVNPVLAAKGRAWHTAPASDKQVQYLANLTNRPAAQLRHMSRGELAQAITHAQAAREVARYRRQNDREAAV